MMRFEDWQAGECAMLGVTPEQHNTLLDMSARLDAATGGLNDYYGAMRHLVMGARLSKVLDATSGDGPDGSTATSPYMHDFWPVTDVAPSPVAKPTIGHPKRNKVRARMQKLSRRKNRI